MHQTSIRSAGGVAAAENRDVAFLQTLKAQSGNFNTGPDSIAGRVFATEGIDDATTSAIFTQETNLRNVLHSVAARLNVDVSFGAGDVAHTARVMALENAAIQGAFAANAAGQFLARETKVTAISPNTFTIGAEGVPGFSGKRSPKIVAAVEAFDQVQQRNAALYTMAYNYTVALQSEFGEALYPLLTLPADQVGFGIVVNRLVVQRGVTHEVSGKVVDFGKVDLCRAAYDHTVLSRYKNRVVPVVRAAAEDKLIDSTLVAPVDYTVEGNNFKTAPYRTGVEIGIIGLSQTDAQLAGGSANQTDTLDPAISLENLYIKAGNDVLKIGVYGRQGANFTYAQQDRGEDRRLNFDSKYIVLTKDTKQADGSALGDLSILATKELSVVLNVGVNGTANTEFGSVAVYHNRVAVIRVLDKDGNVLPTTSADYQDVVAAFANAKVEGYDLRAYKTNVNLRERGDYIDRGTFTQLYEVPLLSPITAQRPIASNGEHDAADFETLVTATRFRLMNDAVTAVFEHVDRIRDYTAVPFQNEDAPAGLGASRFHVKPYMADYTGSKALDVATMTLTLDSANAARNVQAAIVNKLRDVAFAMYVESEYPAGAAALGMTGEVTLIIACDPIVRRYLQVDGELRTLTEKFNVKIVDTVDRRFTGKIFMTFGVFNESRNQAPNIMNWGNLVWSPELVVSANMPKGDAMARETIVQPRYLFVNHLPVCAMLEVKNIGLVFDETLLRVKQV